MKYAFMSFSAPAATLAELVGLARRYGYEGIEPRIGSGHAHGLKTTADAAARAAAVQTARDAGVALCCIATSCKYCDPQDTAAQIVQTRAALDLAADLGVPCIRVFGGQIKGGLTRDQAIAHLAAALLQVADYAAHRQVAICLETHDDWCDPAHVAAVMTQAHHPAIAVNWDIMHPVRAAKVAVADAFAILRPWIRHVHVHDGTRNTQTLEFRPIGQGEVDHATALRLLRVAGYQGYLSGEWINWTPAEEHLPAELATLRRLDVE